LVGVGLLKDHSTDLHGLLRQLNTVGNKIAAGVDKPVVEIKYLEELKTKANKADI
jgi:hypothetical protein